MQNKIIISEQDIINTYNEKQQEQCKLYHKYLEIRKQNPDYGHKRLAKKLGVTPSRVAWWYFKDSPPVPIQTINYLKEKKLIPLKKNDKRIKLIAKILGTTLGDGGIFTNLNAIFLSSSELEAVKEFGEDLKIIFGKEIENNSRIIEGGEYGHSWCYQNTNRKVIRLFCALTAPIGKKSKLNLEVPNWISIKKEIEDSFFSSFFGGELGTPTIHKNKNQLTSLDLGLQTEISSKDNKINFLNQVGSYLNNRNIRTGSISISCPKRSPDRLLLRLQISKDLDNFYNFVKTIKLGYCNYKQERLNNTLKDFINLKYHRFRTLLFKYKNKEHVMRRLKLTHNSLEIIKQQRKNPEEKELFTL